MRIQRFLLMLLTALLLTVPAYAGDATLPEPAKIDEDYIREHYPEVYQQILKEGREAALKESGKQEAVQGKPAGAEVSKEAAAPKKEVLGDWWNRSSLEYEPMPSNILYHTELQFGYERDNGNVDAYSDKGGGKLILRLDRFTNSLSYAIEKSKQQDITSGGATIRDNELGEESLQYDITKKLYFMGGLIREVNRDDLLAWRYALYGGFGYPILALKNHRVELFMAYADLDEKYDPLISNILGFSGRKYTAAYFNQTYKWTVTDNILFSEKFRVIHSLEAFTR